MKILILNKDLPYFPGRAGHEYLNTTRLARLSERVGLVSLIHSLDHVRGIPPLRDEGVVLFNWENPHPSVEPRGLRKHVGIFRSALYSLNDIFRTWPCRPRDTYIEDLQFRNIAPLIQRALNESHWDALIVIQSTCARWRDYVPAIPTTVLVLHDIRSLVYQRRASESTTFIGKLVNLIESRMYHSFESRYCKRYDLTITVSKADEKWVRQHYSPRSIVTIPIPVDAEYFQPINIDGEIPRRIVFTGMMSHPPNADGAVYFVDEIFPKIKARYPEAEFWIVGSTPSSQVLSKMTVPGVVVTGRVEDIRPYISQAGIIVVPLRYGSGMRNKILEAWSMEKCVVSTSIGAEGLDYRAGENLLIGDTPEEMVSAIDTVFSNREVKERIRVGGRSIVKTQHHPDVIAAKYRDVIHAACRRKRKPGDPFHALIDLRWMRPGEAGGVENLTRSFIGQLMQLDKYNRYTFLLPREIKYDFDVRTSGNINILVANGVGNDVRGLFHSGMKYLSRKIGTDYWRSTEVEALRFLSRIRPDVVLSMPGYIFTDMYPMKNVLVFLDLQHEYHPEFFTPSALEERRRVYSTSARKADHLIAISEFTRQSLIEKLGIPPKKISTVYEDADPIYRRGPIPDEFVGQVLKKYSLTKGSYLYFPGNTWPHKNHRLAVEALSIVRRETGLPLQLVISGASKEAHSSLDAEIRMWQMDDHVRFLGYCPLEDLPSLYRGAAMLVYPSHFEGFGIPLLEAMAMDCPIVCSNASCLPEIAGDAAVIIDPNSAQDLAKGIIRLLRDRSLRERLIEAGRSRLKQFSWRKFTLNTTGILHQIVNQEI